MRESLGAVEGDGELLEVTREHERVIRWHAGERLELQGQHLDPALEDGEAGLEAVHLDQQEALLQWRRGAPARALPDQAVRLPIGLEEVRRGTEVAACGEQIARLHPHVGDEPALAVGHLGLLHLHLALGDADAPLLAPVQIERHGEADGHVVVGASHVLLAAEVQHGIRPQPGLAQPPASRIDVGAKRTQLGIVGERARHDPVHADSARGQRLSRSGPSARDHSEGQHQDRRREHGRAPTAPEPRTAPSPSPRDHPS